MAGLRQEIDRPEKAKRMSGSPVEHIDVMKARAIVFVGGGLLLLGWIALRQPAAKPAQVPSPPAAASNAPPELERELPPPHPKAAIAAPAAAVESPQTNNLLKQLVNGEAINLKLEQLTNYLRANHRDAGSLLAAYQATHERALLDEALTNFPNDPRVAYTAWFRSEPAADDPDALKARRQALDKFEQADPDNALANYLSAANYFKTGHPDQAVQELQAGAAKTKLDDYNQEAIQNTTEAYEAAGFSELEAKLTATTGALLPDLAEIKSAGASLIDLANSYRQAGDASSAQSALQMCLDLGQRLNDPNALTLIQDLVGIAVERRALDAMAASAPDAEAAQAIQKQIDALAEQRGNIKSLAANPPMEQWLQTTSPEDVIAYLDRMRIFGEQKAMRWKANRTSSQ